MSKVSKENQEQDICVDGPVYEATPQGFVWYKPTNNGVQHVPLTNWTAQIVGDILEDDGVETHRTFEIEAKLNGAVSRFTLSASEFEAMRWPTTYLGAGAITYSSQTYSYHAKVAIQLQSLD